MEFESDEALLEQAKKDLISKSKTRFESLQEDGFLVQAAKRPEFLENNAASITSLIFECVPSITENVSRSSVERLMHTCLKNETFFKFFAGALVKQGMHVRGKRECYYLAKWMGVVLQRLSLPEAQKPILKLLQASAHCLDQLKGRALCRAMKKLQSIVVSKSLRNEALQIAVDVRSLSLLLLICRTLVPNGSENGPDRSKILSDYCTNILNAKTTPSFEAMMAYKPLLESLDKTEFEEALLPTLTRSLRRNPEVGLAAAVSLLSVMNLDLTASGIELQKQLIPFLRHSQPEVQTTALDVQFHISKRISDRDVVQQMADHLMEWVSGKVEGKIKSATERAALIKAFGVLSASPATKSDLGLYVSESLCAFYRSEIHDDVKSEVLKSLGGWLKFCNKFSESSLKTFEEALNGKEVLRLAALKGLSIGHSNISLFSNASSIVPFLCKAVETGLSKVSSRVEGILAFLALSVISANHPPTDALMDKTEIWDKSLNATSPFFDPSTISKLPIDVCESLVSLCQQLLLSHVSRVDQSKGCVEMISKALVLLCLHSIKSVRSLAYASVLRCIGSTSSLLVDFLEAFKYWLSMGSETFVYTTAGNENDVRLSRAEMKDRMFETLLHLLPIEFESDPSVLSKLLLISHHPLLHGAKDPNDSWKRILKAHRDLESVLKENLEPVLQALAEDSGLKSNNSEERKASLEAVSVCSILDAETAFSTLKGFIDEHLDKEEIEQLTEADLLIFHTPEGQLSSETQDSIVIIQDTKKKQKKKKPKGRYRHDKVAFAEQSESSEEEEEPPPKPKLSEPNTKTKRPGHMGAAERQIVLREKRLVEEAEIRSKVAKIKAKLELGLDTLTALIEGNLVYAADVIATLANHIVPFLTFDLVGEGAAFVAMTALAKSLPIPLNAIPLDVTIVLREVNRYEKDGSIPIEEILSHPSMSTVIGALISLHSESRFPKPLHSAQFCIQGGLALFLMFPVLRVALHSLHSPFFDSALQVLTDHCVPGENLPRTEIFALLFHVLSQNSSVKDIVVKALQNLCIDLIGDEIFSVLEGLLSPSSVVRGAALEALAMIPSLSNSLPIEDDRISSMLILACHDVDERNALRAQELFQISNTFVKEGQMPILSQLIGHETADIRQAAVKSLTLCLKTYPHLTQKLINSTTEVIENGCSEAWLLGGALMFELCAEYFASRQTRDILDFLLTHGLTHSNDNIRGEMVKAGLALINAFNPRDIDDLFQLLDQRLNAPKNKSSNVEADDRMREGTVVLLGSVAQHLFPDDPKVKDIVLNLLEVLSTPSEAVQRSASECLSPLIEKCQNDANFITEIVNRLKKQISEGKSYGQRRGAAYGMAGVVKGCGISSLKNFEIMDTLMSYVEDKSSATTREGAIATFDCLSQRLGKRFEPYVIHILPLLLTCFGDASRPVRDATSDASRTIMNNLTNQGVKLVLPALLKGLEDKAWRTKQGSIQLLGTMAYCSAKQLSTCLPTVVPKLIAVLADPHPKVHTAAEWALQEVASTIRNPEIMELVPDILNAIAYPSKNTVHCLDKLLESKFANTIDAPSLALIIPVVHHGLKDRAGENKKRASRIVQNLCKLVNDAKDMDPYIHILLPELKKCVVDTLPDVRAQASKALSNLMFDMGKQALDEVMPWLLGTLESKSSPVERSGAAQAISEVLAVFGEDYFKDLLPKILENCRSASPFMREGGVAVLRFLPYSMPDLFREKLDIALPCILDGLADENESVREISLAAGRTLVEVYAVTSLPIILPAVEQSLFNINWRIRQSSVELLGNLIFKVAGTSGKVKLDGGSDDEGPATSGYGRNLIKALGLERRNAVLAKLYMSRSDVQHPVRTAALHIWKTVVVNTPKTLMEMLSSLMDLMIEMLASGEEDARQTAARCLGELVRKMGDRFLPRMIPMIEKCFASDDAATREGVCYGLRELLDSLNNTQLAEYLPKLLPTIQSTLIDDHSAVREAAAGAFDALFKTGASSVVDSIIPDLLQKLEKEKESHHALEGLRVILSIRPHTFENILPKLMKEPVNEKRLRAIASLSEVAPSALRTHLATLMKLLMRLGNHTHATDVSEMAREAAKTIVSVVLEEHMQNLVSELRKGLDDTSMKFCAAMLIGHIASGRNITDHVESLLQSLVSMMSEDDPVVLQECWKAMKVVAATVPKELRPTFIRVLSDSVDTAKEKERRKDPSKESIIVPGFCLPDSIAPILPFYTEGVQATSVELRESAAVGLGELVSVMDTASLNPFVGIIVGPLIRIINDRFPWQIKLAILKTMGLLIHKSGDDMRKFVPALQPIFLKCLPDPAEAIRQIAADNLGRLTQLSPRLDPLMNNLLTFAVKMEPPMRNAYLSAMAKAFVISGEKISSVILKKTETTLKELISNLDENEDNAMAMGVCLGSFCKCCDIEFVKEILTNRLEEVPILMSQKLLNAVLMANTAKYCPERLREVDLLELFVENLSKFAKDDNVPIKKAACRTAARLLMSDCKTEVLKTAVIVICTCLSPDQSTELQEEALKSVQLISYSDRPLLKAHLKEIVPLLCAMARESTAEKKVACETTLSLVLDLDDGLVTAHNYLSNNPGATAKSLLAEPYLRRIQRFAKPSEHEPELY